MKLLLYLIDQLIKQSHLQKIYKKIFSGSWLCEGKRRNYGIKKCTSDWILEIDADEIVTKNLKEEILKKKDWWNLIFFLH